MEVRGIKDEGTEREREKVVLYIPLALGASRHQHFCAAVGAGMVGHGRMWAAVGACSSTLVVAGAVHTTRITLRLQAGQAVCMYVLYVASVIIEVSCPVVCMSVHVLRYSFVSVR